MNKKLILIHFLIVLGLAMTSVRADQPDTLDGRNWLAEDIDGKGVIDMLQTTLEFGEDGRVGGNGGCNRFFGSVTINGQGIEFSSLGATRKMCPESIMNQEVAFMQALANVARWDMKNGLLYMFAGDDEAILRFSEIDNN